MQLLFTLVTGNDGVASEEHFFLLYVTVALMAKLYCRIILVKKIEAKKNIRRVAQALPQMHMVSPKILSLSCTTLYL